MLDLAAILLALLATGPTTPSPASRPPCESPDAVRFDESRLDIRDALRTVATQAKLHIAVRTDVRGVVATPTDCVAPKVAIRVIASQVGAGYCDEGDVIYVSRTRRGCRGAFVAPSPNARVKNPRDR